jgi:HEAT repeat protein
LIIRFLFDGRATIRAAAIRSIGLLSKGRPNAVLFDATHDESRKVAREACHALRYSIDAIELPRLADLFRNELRTSVLLSLLDLIDVKETWAAMPYLIEAAASHNDDVARAAAVKIGSKFNHVFTNPSEEERAAILAALQRGSSAVPAALATEFTQWLESRA